MWLLFALKQSSYRGLHGLFPVWTKYNITLNNVLNLLRPKLVRAGTSEFLMWSCQRNERIILGLHISFTYLKFQLSGQYSPLNSSLSERLRRLCMSLLLNTDLFHNQSATIPRRNYNARSYLSVSYQWSTVGILSEESVFRQGVSSVVSDGVYRSLLRLVFNCLVQHEQRSGDMLLEVAVHTQWQPVGQQLLNHELRPTVTETDT